MLPAPSTSAVVFDRGPPARFARLFAAASAPPDPEHFWIDWGPVFYRGRLDGSAKVLCIGSDPGTTERIAGRVLVGDAGQRVQGFLARLGLTRSYLCLNAFPYSLFPAQAAAARARLGDAAQLAWRNRLYEAAVSPELQAIVAFGDNAQEAVRLWDTKPNVLLKQIPHPSSRDEQTLLERWRAAITDLRAVVTPDPGGDTTLPNYGQSFEEADYAAIPRHDLPFGVPPFLGDDSRGRAQQPPQKTSVTRPPQDDLHTLIWKAPG